MFWVWIISGALCLLTALIAFAVSWNEGKTASMAIHTSSIPIKSLLEIYNSVHTSVGGEHLFEQCEIKGRIAGPDFLEGRLTKRNSVFYEYTAQRLQDDGSFVEVAAEKQQERFWVEDETGRILVDPTNATLELPEPQVKRTPKHIYEEKGLYEGDPVYILGWLSDFHGQPIITSNGMEPFLITWRSESDVIRQARANVQCGTWAGIGLFITGLVLMGLGVLT